MRCSKLLWDLEVPSYDIASGGWKSSRTLGFYAARWPDSYIVDLSDASIRDVFSPTDVATSTSVARLRQTTHRQIRQPDGMSLGVTINLATKGGMYLGIQPSLLERPDPLIEVNPPVIAWWLSSRLNDASAIGVLASEPDRIEFEMIELKAQAEIRKAPKSDGWYLSKLMRLGSDSKPWWSAEFQSPQTFGSSQHVLGTVRMVEVVTSERTVGKNVIPASPRTRRDVLLEAVLQPTCPDEEFVQDVQGLKLASVSAPLGTQVEAESRKQMEKSYGAQGQSGAAAPHRSSDPMPDGSWKWWTLGAAGVVCVVTAAILSVRKKA